MSDPQNSTDPGAPEVRAGARVSASPPWGQLVAFAIIYVIWGSTYLGIRVAVRTLPPFSMAACRFLLAGTALYAILRARGVAAPRRGEWIRASLAGFLMLSLGNGLVTWAEQRVPSNRAALMIAAVPLFTAMLDWLRPGGVRPRPRAFLGIGIGALGMALLVASHGAGGKGETSTLGLLALLLSALAWASGSLYSRYGSMHPHPIMAAAQQMICGGAAMAVIAVARGEPETLVVSAFNFTSVVAFLYLTVFGSMVAFSAFGWLVKESTPSRLSTTAYVNPVVAVVLGWVVLGETLGPSAILGALLIVGAVVVMTLPNGKSLATLE